MIRINLLPQRREPRAAAVEAGQGWMAVLLGAVFVEAVALFFLHQAKLGELTTQQRRNQEITNQISDIKKAVANHETVKKQLAVFRQREEAIAKLQSARTGPTGVLLELSQVLTPGRGPSIDADKLAQLRRDNPLSVPNPSWDARRLWLTNYKEGDRVVTLEGLARDGEDVSELARRLSLSSYFGEVKLLPAAKILDNDTKLELLKFQLQAKVRY